MAKKVALLIGVSEYGEGIPFLSAPLYDVTAMKRVLENPNMGGFDELEILINPDLAGMQKAVQQILETMGAFLATDFSKFAYIDSSANLKS